MPEKRPFGVTLLLWLVLSLSAWGLVRLLTTLRSWDVLSEFEARLSPLYLSITGAGWVVAGGVLLWSAFSRRWWTHRAIFIAVFLWLAEYWIERVFFQESRANLAFALIASSLLLAFTGLNAFHRTSRRFFIKSEEHEQPNEYPEST